MPLFSFSGKRPDRLGVEDGQLTPCPSTPNCVCSQAPADDREHFVEPIAYAGEAPAAIAKLKSIIESMDRTEVIEVGDRYLYVEFTSRIMGFVDDVEFYADPAAQVIHVRAAARLGKSDLGVNRSRVEKVRAAFVPVREARV